MKSFGQSAIESGGCPVAGTLRGQGATEYLVLLAVVLIIALVSVALLGFFPGMASDAQLTQSRIYWQSASPIQVVEMDARAYAPNTGRNFIYLRVRNAGSYPMRITKLVADGGHSISEIYISTFVNMSDYYYMAPGEEKYFGYRSGWPALPVERVVDVYASGTGASSNGYLRAAQTICQNSTVAPGTMSISGFGFEYIQYIDGQQITKRQAGAKPLVITCREPIP